MVVFHHLALNCHDVKAQEAFYANHFGFRRVRTFRAGRPDEFVMLRSGSVCLELFPAPSAQGSQPGGEPALGFRHMAFQVDDLNRAVKGLNDDGVRTEEIMDLSDLAAGLKICFFHDPEGNRIEIMEGYQDEQPGTS